LIAIVAVLIVAVCNVMFGMDWATERPAVRPIAAVTGVSEPPLLASPPEVAAAQAYAPSDLSPATADRYTVIVNGQIVGRDPDADVRLMLTRDPRADAS